MDVLIINTVKTIECRSNYVRLRDIHIHTNHRHKCYRIASEKHMYLMSVVNETHTHTKLGKKTMNWEAGMRGTLYNIINFLN